MGSANFGSSSFGLEDESPFTVSELVELVAETLEGQFRDVLLVGEIASFSSPASGHCYFSLRDENAAMDCVIWRADAQRLTFRPEAGDEVLCRGRLGLYAKQGRMQVYVQAMKPVGEGAAAKALEALRAKLGKEGVFDEARKRPLPYLPRTIGLVTSKSGAVLHDILTTLGRRFPHFHLILAPAAVQGDSAPDQITAALARLAALGSCDVVIVGRGGGAASDLSAFNSEQVVRAIASFPVPVVSAVGHETDVSLSDLAADLRAATPTAAAEAVLPVYSEVMEELASSTARLRRSARRVVESHRLEVTAAGARLRDPATRLADARQRVDQLAMELERQLRFGHGQAARRLANLRSRFEARSHDYAARLRREIDRHSVSLGRAVQVKSDAASRRLAELSASLDALSPLAVLERGFSVVRDSDGRIVKDAASLAPGDSLQLRFRAGSAEARVVTSSGDGPSSPQRAGDAAPARRSRARSTAGRSSSGEG